MSDVSWQEANRAAREAWDANAAFWDERMGEGNDFVEVLIWPATEQLLRLRPGERVLDVACGNGLTSRRLAAAGGQVVAIDFSEEMIAHARRRSGEEAREIDYRVLDATDEAALLGLGERSFDAALCSMALFDMAEIDPLLRGLAQLLKPGGRFVFSVLHPCFNNPTMAQVAEQEDRAGEIVTTHSVKVWGYMTPRVARGLAIRDQPRPQPLFHRPLAVLLGAGFRAGFVLDGLEERAFPPDHPPGRHPLSWSGRFSEIPPVLVARMTPTPNRIGYIERQKDHHAQGDTIPVLEHTAGGATQLMRETRAVVESPQELNALGFEEDETLNLKKRR